MDMDCESDTENDIVELQAALLPTSVITHDIFLNQEHMKSVKSHLNNESDYSDYANSVTTALKLNHMLDDALAQVKSNLVSLLAECRTKIQAVQTSIDGFKIEQQRNKNTYAFGYYLCGIPYFKDPKLFPAPPNQDTLKMNKLRILNYVNLPQTIPWTAKDKNCLETSILNIVRTRKSAEVKYDIKKLNLQLDNIPDTDVDNVTEKLHYLSDYLNKINSLSLSDLVKPLTEKEEYDWEQIADTPGLSHNANECRSMWLNFLHPSINKASWSHTEQVALKDLIRKHTRQDWTTIAAKLKTNRSGYQCFIFYKMHVSDVQIRTAKWTPEEDQFLLNVIDSCRIGDFVSWTKVSFYFENRTKDQIYHRYKYSLEGSRRCGRFTVEEDTVLLAALKQYGNDFCRIAKFLPTRTPLQIRVRLQVLKSPTSEWTLDEDKKLLDILSQPDFKTKEFNYSEISKYFNGKSRGSVRNRCITLKKWIKANPKKKLALIPRRKLPKRGNSNIPDVDLETAIILLQKSLGNSSIPTKIISSSESQETPNGIDTKFLNYFKTICNYSTLPVVASSSSKMAVSDMKSIFTLLHVRFKKSLAGIEISRGKNEKSVEIVKTLMDNEKLSIAPIKNATVRTYSRKKNTASTNSLNESSINFSSIWSEIPAPQSNQITHIIPPFYGTVAAFKQLMLKTQDNNINSILPRESDSHALLWRARFEALFLWPAHLATITPNITYDLFQNEESVDQT